LTFVYNHLTEEANNTLISEYAKRESSWKRLKERFIPKFRNNSGDYLIPVRSRKKRKWKKEIDITMGEIQFF